MEHDPLVYFEKLHQAFPRLPLYRRVAHPKEQFGLPCKDLVDFEQVKHYHQMMREAILTDRRLQAKARAAFHQEGLLVPIERWHSLRKGAYPPDYVDLWYLYQYIRWAQPRQVLELGSGLSTLVMAEALRRNGEGGLIALEPGEDWARKTSNTLPVELRAIATVKYAPPVSCRIGDKESVTFSELPLRSPDMIYVDGAHKGAKFLGFEVVWQLEQELPRNVAVFVDARWRFLYALFELHRSWHLLLQGYVYVNLGNGKSSGGYFGLDLFQNAFLALAE